MSTAPPHTRRSDDRPEEMATVADTARIAGLVVVPSLVAGVIKRRPAAMKLLARLDIDRPAVGLCARLRRRYGPGPIRLRVPFRSVALVLSGIDTGRILDETPDPFSPATIEKRGALGHFQPHGVLISQDHRRLRREFNERILQPQRPLHELAPNASAIVAEEMHALLDGHRDILDWDEFNRYWSRAVRRMVFGDAARDDVELTENLDRLRKAGNWAYLVPRRRETFRKFDEDVREWVAAAPPGSLAALVAAEHATADVDRPGQIPHWLFAFDAAGMAIMRTLALLGSHPEDYRRAVSSVEQAPDIPQEFRFLRASVLESLRLWPTTPLLLRESNKDTEWGGETLRRGTTFLMFATFLHRDPDTMDYADRFTPDIWLDGRAERERALVPFSGGTAICPGRNIVLLATTTALAALISRHRYTLTGAPATKPDGAVVNTFDNFGARFSIDG